MCTKSKVPTLQERKKERKKIPCVLPHHWSVSLFECLSRMEIGPMACEANNNCKLQKNLILSLVCKTSLLPRARHCVHSLSLLCFLRCRSRIRKVAKAARIATKATAPTTMPTMLPVDSPFDVVCTTATGHIGKTTI